MFVEPVSIAAHFGRVELKASRAPSPRPLLGLIEKLLADASGAVAWVHREVFNPYATTEADRFDVVIGGAEAD